MKKKCNKTKQTAWFSSLLRQETEWIYSYNPGAHMGLSSQNRPSKQKSKQQKLVQQWY